MVRSRPYVILSNATSIDGKIATRKGHSKLSSKTDLIRLHKLRSRVDAILVGKNTVIRDNPLLTVRYSKGKNPIRIILDSYGTISSKSKILQSSSQIPTIVAICKKISKKNLIRLQKFPIEIISTGINSVNLNNLLHKLYSKNIRTILVEGGGTVNWQFIQNNLFDEMIITITPFVIGGTDSVSLIQGKGFSDIKDSPTLSLFSVKRLGNDLVLHYRRV